MINQFRFDDFNPDAMNEDEIRQWLEAIGQGRHPRIAKQWFPGVKGQFALARSVRCYLWNKLTAIRCRLDGKIDRALEYERICDDIYQRLPEVARW